MQQSSLTRLAWIALGIGVVATGLALMLSFGGVRATLPGGVAAALGNAVMWCPFVLVLLFLIAQRSPDARYAVTLGYGLTDAWYFVLVMNMLLLGMWHHLGTFAPTPFGWGSEPGIVGLGVALLLLIFRLHQLRGQWRLVQPHQE